MFEKVWISELEALVHSLSPRTAQWLILTIHPFLSRPLVVWLTDRTGSPLATVFATRHSRTSLRNLFYAFIQNVILLWTQFTLVTGAGTNQNNLWIPSKFFCFFDLAPIKLVIFDSLFRGYFKVFISRIFQVNIFQLFCIALRIASNKPEPI